jgi:hypothetical protein
MQKLGMKPVPGVSRVTIKKSKNVRAAGRRAGMDVWDQRRWRPKRNCAHAALAAGGRGSERRAPAGSSSRSASSAPLSPLLTPAP